MEGNSVCSAIMRSAGGENGVAVHDDAILLKASQAYRVPTEFFDEGPLLSSPGSREKYKHVYVTERNFDAATFCRIGPRDLHSLFRIC